jgi:iron uptake system component EfeO
MEMTAARMGKAVAIATFVSVGALSIAACGSSSDADTGKSANTLKVTLTDQGCSPARLTTPAGPVTIAVSNGGSSAVTEIELKDKNGIIVGERENVAGGLSSSFSLNVKPGTYVMNCPNGEEEDNGVLLVTGKASAPTGGASAPLLARAVAGYHRYIAAETAELLAGTRRFAAALESGDTAQAKALFGPVRRHYEAIEPVAESFGDLDPQIDARLNDVPNVNQWTGFHRIERTLWTQNTTAGTTPYAKRLLADVIVLNDKAKALDFQAAQLANGAVELLNEVASSKITGEEDRYSHTDLSDFAGNLAGARAAFELLRPALVARGDGELAGEITARFAAVQKSLDAYRRNTPLGYAYYSELTPADRRQFAAQVDALAEPLSTVASRVTG